MGAGLSCRPERRLCIRNRSGAVHQESIRSGLFVSGGFWICDLGLWSKGARGQKEGVDPIKTGDRGGWVGFALDGVNPTVKAIVKSSTNRRGFATIMHHHFRLLSRGPQRDAHETAWVHRAWGARATARPGVAHLYLGTRNSFDCRLLLLQCDIFCRGRSG